MRPCALYQLCRAVWDPILALGGQAGMAWGQIQPTDQLHTIHVACRWPRVTNTEKSFMSIHLSSPLYQIPYANQVMSLASYLLSSSKINTGIITSFRSIFDFSFQSERSPMQEQFLVLAQQLAAPIINLYLYKFTGIYVLVNAIFMSFPR